MARINRAVFVKVLGEPTLKDTARELVVAVKGSVTIDWTIRENMRAQLRVIVKRILRKYGYPPDKQEKATQTVQDALTKAGKQVAEELKTDKSRPTGDKQ